MPTDIDNLSHGVTPTGLESIMIKQDGAWVEVTIEEFFARGAQGGYFNFLAGDGVSGGPGGGHWLRGGKGSGGSAGGSEMIEGGEGGPDGGSGGDVGIRAGKGGAGANGGSVIIEPGEAGTGGDPGEVLLRGVPTSDPETVGVLWNDGGTPRFSAG